MGSQVPAEFSDLYWATREEKKMVNVIGVVTDLLPPKQTRGTDSMLTFSIDDGTTFGDFNKGQKIRFFGNQRTFPPIQGPGDVLLLRQVRCMSFSGQTFLVSALDTSWVVFPGPIPRKMPDFEAPLKQLRPNTTAKPTKSEMEYVVHLAVTQNKNKFSAPLSQEAKQKLNAPAEKFSLIKDVGVDRFYDIVGQVVKVFPTQDRLQLYITDYTENPFLFTYETHEEAPDGYGSMTQTGRKWQGPLGRYTLLIYAFPPHSYWTCQNVNPGDFVQVRNVRIRLNRNDNRMIEGALHGEKANPDRVNIKVVKVQDNDRVKDLLMRKQEYGFDHLFDTREVEPEAQRGQKRKGDDEPQKEAKPSKNQRKKKQREKKAQAKAEAEQANRTQIKTVPAAGLAPRNLESTLSQCSSIRHALAQPNTNIRCIRNDAPQRTVSEILYPKSYPVSSQDSTPNSTISRTTVRIVDFQPRSLSDFAKPAPDQEYLSDTPSDSEEANSDSDHSTYSLLARRNGEPKSSASSTKSKSKAKYEWAFALLLEDASPPPAAESPSTSTPISTYISSSLPSSAGSLSSHSSSQPSTFKKSRIITYVSDPDAEVLLNMSACDLKRNTQALAQLREKLFLLWGDLEERKVKEARDRESAALRESSGNAISSASGSSGERSRKEGETAKEKEEEVMTRPFTCCIREYGVLNRDSVWERRFGVCETVIVDGNGVVDSSNGKEEGEVRRLRAPVAG